MYINLCKYHCAEHLGGAAVVCQTGLSLCLLLSFCVLLSHLLNVHVGLYLYSEM